MQFHLNASLKNVHTFSIDQTCDALVEVTTIEELISVYKDSKWSALPKLILGKGSNMLFTDHFAGLIIVNQLTGITLTEIDSHHLLLTVVKIGLAWLSGALERGLVASKI